jgi:hypothetical protein
LIHTNRTINNAKNMVFASTDTTRLTHFIKYKKISVVHGLVLSATCDDLWWIRKSSIFLFRHPPPILSLRFGIFSPKMDGLAFPSFEILSFDVCILDTRVTRLGEFSPNGRIVYFGQFFENYRSSPHSCATFPLGNYL